MEIILKEVIKIQKLSFLKKEPKLKEKLLQWEKNAPEKVKEEIKILRKGTAIDKACAAARLAQMGPKAKGATLALIETLNDWSGIKAGVIYPSRITSPAGQATIALVKIGKKVVQPLIKALDDNDPNVRFNAAYVLGEIKDEQAIDSLIMKLGDKDINVVSAARIALKKIDPYCLWRNRKSVEEAVQLFIQSLSCNDWEVQLGAAFGLSLIKDIKAVEPLINALSIENDYVQNFVELALTKITGHDFGKNQRKWQEFWNQKKQNFQ